MDDFPCKARQVQSRSSSTKNYFLILIKWGSLAMSAGANPINVWPMWLSCLHKCILLLVLRFLWLAVISDQNEFLFPWNAGGGCFLWLRPIKEDDATKNKVSNQKENLRIGRKDKNSFFPRSGWPDWPIFLSLFKKKYKRLQSLHWAAFWKCKK
jgi:hypothetical protein